MACPIHDVIQQKPANVVRRREEDFFQTDESALAHFDAKSRKEVVEPDGIEPTTSCLQSRRSPN